MKALIKFASVYAESRLKLPLLLIVLVALVNTGCSNNQAIPSPTATPVKLPTAVSTVVISVPVTTVTSNNVTRVPVTVISSLSSPLSTIVPSSKESVVTGRVFKKDGKTSIPNVPVYLAKVYWNATHTQGVYALDVNVAPKTTTQKDGSFMFTGVVEGEYAFLIGNPDSYTSMWSDESGTIKVIKAILGTPTTLGDITVNY